MPALLDSDYGHVTGTLTADRILNKAAQVEQINTDLAGNLIVYEKGNDEVKSKFNAGNSTAKVTDYVIDDKLNAFGRQPLSQCQVCCQLNKWCTPYCLVYCRLRG